MKEIIFQSKTFIIWKILGICLLVWYLITSHVLKFSMIGVFLYLCIFISVAILLSFSTLDQRFPQLRQKIFYKEEQSDDSLVAHYKSLLSQENLLLLAGEDSLICIPILLWGITPLSAAAGGIIFGFFHLANFSYFECLGKGIAYFFICLFVLPKGILSVVAGHYILTGIVFLGIIFLEKVVKR